jgi:hypothetical protein
VLGMREKSNDLIKVANTFISEQVGLLANPEYQAVAIDLQNFKKPDFSLSENEVLKEFNNFIEPIRSKIKNKPCIYFFEIEKNNCNRILQVYENLEKGNISALRKNIKKEEKTTCLYVGRSKKTIVHRLKVHFGYRDTTENGLQLVHWAKPLKLKLKLHIYIFPKKLDFLLPLYEERFNREYKPLIGYL